MAKSSKEAGALLAPKAKIAVVDPFAKFGAKAGVGGTIIKGIPVKKKAPEENQQEDQHQEDDDLLGEPLVGNGAPENKEPLQQAPSGKKEPFIKKTVKEAEDAKREAAGAQKALADLQEERKKDQDAIKALEVKLQNAKSQSDFDVLENQLKEAKESSESTSKKYDEAQTRLGFYSFLERPDFKEKYIVPVEEAWSQAAELITDESQGMLLNRIAVLQENFLSAPTPAARKKLQEERDQIRHRLANEVPEFRKEEMIEAINTFLAKRKAQHLGTLNWQAEKKQMDELAADNNRRAGEMVKTRWSKAYSGADEIISPDLKIDKDLRTIMETHNLVPDTTKDDSIATNIISGGDKYQPEDMARVIRQGAAYPVVMAINKGLMQQVKELTETLAEVRGEGTNGNHEDGGSRNQRKAAKEQTEEQKDKFFKRFQPPTGV